MQVKIQYFRWKVHWMEFTVEKNNECKDWIETIQNESQREKELQK